MSWRASAYVAEITSGITRSEKLVLLILANRHNDDTGRCDASLRRLAAETLLHERRLQQVLGALADKGFITITRRPGHTNQYTFVTVSTPAINAGVSENAPPQKMRDTPALSAMTPAISHHGNRKVEPKDLRTDPAGAARALARGGHLVEVPNATEEEYQRSFRAIENLIGSITQPIAEDVGDFLCRGPTTPEWIEEACKEAAFANARSWRYVSAILKRWEREGFKAQRKQRGRPTNGAVGEAGAGSGSAHREKPLTARERGGRW